MMLFLSICSPLLPLIAGWSKRCTTLWYYVLSALSVDLTAYLFKHILHLSYYWLSNVFVLLEFLFLTYYYKNSIFKNAMLFRIISIAGAIVFLVHTTASVHWLTFNYTASSVLYCYYMVLAIAGFYHLLREKKMLFLEQSQFFWANVAILIYASGNFFIFLLRNSVQASDPKMMMVLWTSVFLSLNILKNVLLGVALSKKTET